MSKRIDPATLQLKDQVVSINRVTKVVKGGKNLSFSALVVVGDPGQGVHHGTWLMSALASESGGVYVDLCQEGNNR